MTDERRTLRAQPHFGKRRVVERMFSNSATRHSLIRQFARHTDK
jgi:hypothetical protein